MEALQDHTAVDLRPEYTGEQCGTLAGRSGLVSLRHGRYGLSGKGEAYLAGELDPGELDPGELEFK